MQGDIIGIIDNAGTRVVEYTYGAWGDILSITGTLADTIGQKNPLGYRGYYYDAETGFYYVSSRYYDPEIGRFVNADSAISGTGEAVQGYNLYSYCFNNPVNMSDPAGNWPKFIKELGARIKHTIKAIAKTILSPLKAVKASAGMGIGIGIKGEASINDVNVEVAASTSITDSVSYDKGDFDLKNTSSTKVGITFAEKFDFSYSVGKEHSFYDEKCNCNILHDPFVKQMNCPASKNFQSSESFVGISFGAYLGIGGEVSLGFDFKAWNEELITIFEEPYKGYY